MRMMSLAKTQEAKLEVAELKVILRNRSVSLTTSERQLRFERFRDKVMLHFICIKRDVNPELSMLQ